MEEFLKQRNSKVKAAYRELPSLLREHYGIEETVLAGGYGYRQVVELVQNGADAILEHLEWSRSSANEDRIQVLLTDSWLYVANTGAPLSEEGIDSLLSSHSSPKRGIQIGRFGLGFKSLLRLGGKVDLFSRCAGAGMRFDPARCRAELAEEFAVRRAPGLRLAWPLDAKERQADPIMHELEWAETIVRAEIPNGSIREQVSKEIRSFAPEFLLFFPASVELVLNDGREHARLLRTRRNDDVHALHDGDTQSLWRVFTREIRIQDQQALDDATHLHARDCVPIDWAVPIETKREEAGRFWAFFPTQTPTHIPGIVNAPWKLNSDRNAIIGGEWNAVLMEAAGRMIANSIANLWTDRDPGRPLDAFPRQLERKDDPAAPLVEAVWQMLESASVVADGLGQLRLAHDLRRPPRDVPALAVDWNACTKIELRSEFVHPSCLEGQRSSRLNALAARLETAQSAEGLPQLRREQAAEWFAMIASSEEPACRLVIALAQAYAATCTPSEWEAVRPTLAIVPNRDGRLLPADKLVLASDSVSVPGRSPVAQFILADEVLSNIVRTALKVKAPDDDFWRNLLSGSLAAADTRYSNDEKWRRFWITLRAASDSIQDEFITANRTRIRVKRRDGSWVPFHSVILPGGWIDESTDLKARKILIDPSMHRSDERLLAALGVGEWPEGTLGPGEYKDVVRDNEGKLSEWLEQCRMEYKRKHQNPAFPNYLDPKDLTLPAGWNLLESVDGLTNARLTERFLGRVAEGEFCQPVLLFHRTDGRYPRMEVRHPLRNHLLRHGHVEIGRMAVLLSTVLAKAKDGAFQSTRVWQRFEPAIGRLREIADGQRPTNLSIFWKALLREEGAVAAPDPVMRELWSAAAADGVVPDAVQFGNHELPLSAVLVTASEDLCRLSRKRGHNAVVLDNATLPLWISAGARELDKLVKEEWTDSGPDALLTSALPELADVLHKGFVGRARCRPVTSLRLSVDGVSEEAPCLFRDGVVLLDLDQLMRRSRAARLEAVVKELSGAGWLAYSAPEALRLLGDSGVDKRRAEVAAAPNLAERLLKAVGGRAEALLDTLGDLRSLEFIRNRTPLELAQLVLAQQGPAAFKALRKTLEEEGLRPPARWSGSEAASFLEAIGFPATFAPLLDERREPEEFISGPIELPPLHDFQEEVLEGLRALLAGSHTRRRVVVSLPTGGGKTRVTVEAAVQLVLAPQSGKRSVLWVAQTDELCEQAVQAFRQVWINLGALSTDLRIIRLWGGNPNPASQPLDKPVVVVASIQTLNNRLRSEGLKWLNEPGLVVVDECHHAITPSYTNLLRWLGMMPSKADDQLLEAPIIGLSATPFRTDEDESGRLARRFDNNWLPGDQESLHVRLRAQGVLAEPRYEALDSGTGLLNEEMEKLEALIEPWEGLEFENLLEALNQRLATVESRSQKLVDLIQESDERSILLFSNSVAHAEEMAARLNLVGIPAAAVSGTSAPSVRRFFLDRFRRGEIRVLCNHSVLTTGFDAPNTDMVLIARQVFSPVRYMQIVGRGLRGPKNGGTPACRIVTVIDNLGRFQDRHPYHYCQRYFA